MRKTSLLAILLLISLVCQAKSVVFTLANGTKVYYLLDKDNPPVMRFEDNQVLVKDDRYEVSGIKNFFISQTDDPTPIENVKTMATRWQNGTFRLVGKAEDVAVYNLNGQQVQVNVMSEGDEVNFSLQSLPRGTYIVKVGKDSFKINKR